MTHLLLGFDVGGEVANSRLNPFGEFNCLTVLLELMESTPPSVAAGKQSLGLGANQERGAGHCEAPETAARLVFELAANERTRGPAIELLQNWPPGAPAPAQRLPLLLSDALAASPPAEIEPGSAGSRRAASAHYRSWIMRTAALVLDATAPPFGSFPAASVDDLPPIAGELTRNILSLGLDGDAKAKKPTAKVSADAVREALAKAGGGVRMRAMERTDGVMKVTETRNFAGKEMEVTKTYVEGTKEAKQAAKRDAAAKSGGLDNVLLQLEKTKKLNVLDKSKMDWKDVKEGDAAMEEDLEKHKRGKTYLEEQDFLKRAELREYELERDARLNADVRTRGRL